MTSKHEHKSRLKFLALDSIAEVALKEFLKYTITNKSFLLGKDDEGDEEQDPVLLTTSSNENRALAELFEAGKKYLMDLTILALPEIQNLIFTDKTMKSIKEEINIKKLDVSAILNILLRFPLLPTSRENEHDMQQVLEDIFYFRMVTVNHPAESFWNGITTGAIRLNNHPTLSTWEEVWSYARNNLLKLMAFLRDEGVWAENQHKKWLGEIKLLTTWSKQEILQNYTTQINHQLKTIQYINNVERPFVEQKQVEITIRISEISIPPEQGGWLTSFFSFFKSYVWYNPRNESFMKPYGLDGTYATTIKRTVQNALEEIFDENQASVRCSMSDVEVIPTKFEPSGNTFIPLTVHVHKEDVPNKPDIFTDSKSDSAISLWLIIRDEITNCMDHKMDTSVDVIRTGWKESGQINICLFKQDKSPWTPSECLLVIEVLQKWSFPILLRVYSNPNVLEQLAMFTFHLSTANPYYFGLLEEFANHINNESKERTIYVEREHVELEIISDNVLAKFRRKGELIAAKLKCREGHKPQSPREVPDEQQLPAISETTQQTSIPKRKTSGTYGYGSSPTVSKSTGTTPRSTGTTPRSTGNTPRRPSISREGSFAKTNLSLSPTESNEKKAILSPKEENKGIAPIDQKKGVSMVSQSKGTSQSKHFPGRDSQYEGIIPDNGWIKMMIATEYILKPALLQILHNTRKNPAIKGLPKDGKELCRAVANLRRQKPKSFEKLRRQELKLLFPDDRQTIDSTALTTDLIFFLLRISDVIPAPKNGWINPETPSSPAEYSLSYSCWEANNISKEVSMATIGGQSNIEELRTLMKRLENALNGLDYEAPLLEKLKKENLTEVFSGNVIF